MKTRIQASAEVSPEATVGQGVKLPATEKAVRECLSMPVRPLLSQGDLERMVTAVNALAKAGA